MNNIFTSLSIEAYGTPAEASAAGYFYTHPEYKPIGVEKAVVVLQGTAKKKATVDFILKDETGQKYVFMITRALLDAIPK